MEEWLLKELSPSATTKYHDIDKVQHKQAFQKALWAAKLESYSKYLPSPMLWGHSRS